MPESQQHFTDLTSEVNLDLRGLKIYEEKWNEIRTRESSRDLWRRRQSVQKKSFIEVGKARNHYLTYSWKVL